MVSRLVRNNSRRKYICIDLNERTESPAVNFGNNFILRSSETIGVSKKSVFTIFCHENVNSLQSGSSCPLDATPKIAALTIVWRR